MTAYARLLVIVMGTGLALGPGARHAAGQESTPSATPDTRTWRFDDTPVGELPDGWTSDATHPDGAPNAWSVQPTPPSGAEGRVLALPATPAFRGGTFNLCWTDGVAFGDGTISVRVLARTGRVDEGGGPAWRVRDANNYYVARWNPLEQNFRLYYVKDGRRVQLDSAATNADPAAWHDIQIRQRGNFILGYLDGDLLLQAIDDTLPAPGGVGVWTKADAASLFDDFTVELAAPLAPAGPPR